MRGPRTLSLYVAREVVLYTLLGVAAITIVMVSRNLLRELDKLIAAGFRIGDVLTVAKVLGTLLSVYALPVAFLFGVLLAIGRMAADVEITAMRACGVGLRGLVYPIALMGVALSLLTLKLTLDVEPAAYRDLWLAFRQMLVRGASVEAGRFNSVGGRTLYADSRGDDGRLRGVMISDRSEPRRPFLVFAEAGRMHLDESTMEWVLRLEHGDVHVEPAEDEPDRYQRIAFDELEYRIDVAGIVVPERQQRPRALPIGELREMVARIEADPDVGPLREPAPVYRAQLQRRYALPAAPVLFALVGVPLGMRRTRGARSYGVLLCALLAFSYYALEAFCELLVTEHGFEPAVVWLPNLGFAVLGFALLVRARRAV